MIKAHAPRLILLWDFSFSFARTHSLCSPFEFREFSIVNQEREMLFGGALDLAFPIFILHDSANENRDENKQPRA